MSFCINPRCPKPKSQSESRYCRVCGSDLLLDGKYRVTRPLSAKGGFGNTYEATDAAGVPKVLKVLTYTEPKAIELFRQEAEVLKQLKHPGIPKGESYFIYYPRDSETPLHCLVMEKIEGIDLEEYQHERGFKPISADLCLDWLTQLGNILHEVHRRKFFHRDIKPSNIILRPDGQLVLIDFGAARQVTKTVLSGRKNTGIYTPGYAPPEQSMGHSVPQSDFYALGKTFVFLLTGKEPDDPTIYDINTNAFNWRKYAPNLPTKLADLLDRMMAEKPIDRPADTSILLREIAALKNAETPRVAPKTGLLSKLEALSVKLSPRPAAPDAPPPPIPEKPKGNITPSADERSSPPADFSDRLKASFLDSIIVAGIAALVGGYLCTRAMELDYVRSLDLDFNHLKTLPFLDSIPLDLYIPHSFWKYYAAGFSALGTTTLGLALVIFAIVYHINFQILPIPESLALFTCLGTGIAIEYLYFVIFEYAFKGTIGKMFLDLSVTDERGRRISLARANRRYWSKILSTLPFYFGFVPIACTKKKRALHDRLTGTRISRKK